jgi:hypothetical protein
MRTMLLVAVALAVASPTTSDDGTAVPSCATKLVPCAAFLNSTATPPAATCCGPLKEAAFNESKCVCAMLLNKAALQELGVAPEQGLALAKRCGVTVGASVCDKYTAAGAAAGSSASSTGTTPAASSTGNGGTTLRRHGLVAPSMAVGFIVWWTVTTMA